MPSSIRLRHPAILAFASAIAFGVVTAAYRAGALRQLDATAANLVRANRAPWLDQIGSLDDVAFRPTPVFAAAAVLALILWRFGPPWSWVAPLGVGAATIVDFALKLGWSVLLHPRQLIAGAQILLGAHMHGLAPYPSGHVERALFLGVIGLALLPRWLSYPLLALALTTPAARVYTDAHRLSEVTGGAVLGIGLAGGAIAVAARLPRWWARAREAARRRTRGRPGAAEAAVPVREP